MCGDNHPKEKPPKRKAAAIASTSTYNNIGSEQPLPGLSMLQLVCIPVVLLAILPRAQCFSFARLPLHTSRHDNVHVLSGWVQGSDDSWEWEEDDPNYSPVAVEPPPGLLEATATPQLPSGVYRPKQSLGQNYLKDPNTVAKIVKAFHSDATRDSADNIRSIVELGPGAGALTDRLVDIYGGSSIRCVEIDPRSVELLVSRHPMLTVDHADVLQVNYPEMAEDQGRPLVLIGNLPYYITSQILFALADASHSGSVYSATVTMQWEVAQRMVAKPMTKDYGILSVVFQLYADVNSHFKIPPTVFYPKPKVDSALVGLHFHGPTILRERLAGVLPAQLRRIVTTSFQQRRKTVRNSLRKIALEVCDSDADRAKELFNRSPLPLAASSASSTDAFEASCALPDDWASKRPEEFTPGQFVELTRIFFGTNDESQGQPLGGKVWRKLKHGSS